MNGNQMYIVDRVSLVGVDAIDACPVEIVIGLGVKFIFSVSFFSLSFYLYN